MKTTQSPSIGHRTRVGQQRRARTRARIVEAAMQVYAEKGPDAAVIDDFIRVAGVARGTFYNYFTRPEQLLSAVSRKLEDDLIRSIETAMAGLDDPVARLATGLRLWLRWARANPAGCGFVVRSRFRGALVERQLASDLEAGRAAGKLRFASVPVARDVVVGSVLESMNRMLAEPVPAGHIEDAVATILRALGLDARSIARERRRPAPAIPQPPPAATVPSSRR